MTRTLQTLNDVIAELDVLPELQGAAKDAVLGLLQQFKDNETIYQETVLQELLSGEHNAYHLIDLATEKPSNWEVKYTKQLSGNAVRRFNALKQAYLYGRVVMGLPLHSFHLDGPHGMWQVINTIRNHDVVEQVLASELDPTIRHTNNKYDAPVFEVERMMGNMEMMLNKHDVIHMHPYKGFEEIDAVVRERLFPRGRVYPAKGRTEVAFTGDVRLKAHYSYSVVVYLNPTTGRFDSGSEVMYQLAGIDQRFLDYVVAIHIDEIVIGLGDLAI